LQEELRNLIDIKMKRILIMFIAAAALLAYCSRAKKDRMISVPESSPIADFISSVSQFNNVNSIDWETIPELVNDPIVFNDEEIRCIDSLGTPGLIPDRFKSNCESLKNYVHMKSLPLRSLSSEEVVQAIDEFENAFDTLFLRCVSQEYYYRLFHDCFNETIPPALDDLAGKLRKVYSNSPASADPCPQESPDFP